MRSFSEPASAAADGAAVGAARNKIRKGISRLMVIAVPIVAEYRQLCESAAERKVVGRAAMTATRRFVS
jgi:predicted phosphoribosyltransferase